PSSYKTPSFPSLYMPGSRGFKFAFLYHLADFWRFTFFWSLIFNNFVYFLVAVFAILNLSNKNSAINSQGSFSSGSFRKMKRNLFAINKLLIVLLYLFIASIQAFVASSIISLIIGTIYQSILLKISTWIPVTWSMIQILFVIITSLPITSTIL
ncbi:May24p ASCRUDRAFT_18360, partial [Ascoidea rubescens DSM 1968]